jgi:PucR C-terminal helix-turn-helix domain
VAQSAADVAGALAPRAAELSADVYELIVREIPQLRADRRVLTLLEASVGENVATMLHVLQHGIDLERVRAPAAAEEYARRLAQRGVPVAALLRAYRIGSARFQDWCRAWLPLGAGDGFAVGTVRGGAGGAEPGMRLAFGAAGAGVSGFGRSHRQALGAHAVALAAGPSGPLMTSFGEVAPLALMSSSIELLRAWVVATLGSLADDDHHARLRDTLRVFLQENGSFKATAERLTLHKNSVQSRVRKAEEGLGRPIDEDRLHVELALLASQWLGATVLRQVGAPRP